MDVRLPDGTVINNVPEGTTKEQLIGKLQNNGYDVSALIRQVAGEKTTAEMSGTQKFLAGAGKAVADLGRGLKQVIGMGDEKEIAESRQRDKALTSTGAGLAGNIVGGVGIAAPTMLLPGANTLVGSALIGGGIGASQPTVGDESRVLNAMTGTAGGALGYGIAKGAGKLISPTESSITTAQQRALSGARDFGVQATPGSATGTTALRQIEASAESLPFTSGPFAALKSQNQEVLNRSAAKAIGEQSDIVSGEVLNNARARIGAVFDATEAIPAIPILTGVQNKLAAIELKYRGLLDKPLAEIPVVKDIYNALGSSITGKQYNDWQSQIGKMVRSKFSGGQSDPNFGFALAEVKAALDDAASSVMTGAEKKAFDTAKQQWKNLVMLEAGGVVNEQTGNVSGRMLANVLSRKDKHGFRLGGESSDLYNMARFYKAFPGVVGDSGTATRSSLPYLAGGAVVGGLGSGAATDFRDPGAAAGMGILTPLAIAALSRGAAGAYLSPIGQSYITNQLLNPAVKSTMNRLGTLSGADAYLKLVQP
jgi:hypothetical protein